METSRRQWLRVVGVGGAVGVLGSAAAAWADRLRILGGEGGGPESFVVGRVSPDFQRFVVGVRVAEARGHGSLLVFWLHGAPGTPLRVATLEEARAGGGLLITERDEASVPELIVENSSKSSVLLLAGEILLGGKQHRVLTEDILLPPWSGPRPIGVYCVEQGRWAGRTKEFEAKGSFATPGLRSRVMEKAGQDRVWAEVDAYARRAQAASPTRSFQEVYERPEVKDHLEDVARGIDAQAAPGALGAAVFVGSTLAGLDLFFDPGLFAREWPKLLRAQALESYREPDRGNADARRLRERVVELLAVAARAEATVRTNAGVGELFEFRLKGVRGSALVFDGRVVHTGIL